MECPTQHKVTPTKHCQGNLTSPNGSQRSTSATISASVTRRSSKRRLSREENDHDAHSEANSDAEQTERQYTSVSIENDVGTNDIVRRSSRARHQILDNCKRDEGQENLQKMEADVGENKSPECLQFGSNETRRGGQGVGKGGLKRDKPLDAVVEGEAELAVDMYSRIKRKRSQPGYYMESSVIDEESSNDEYIRLRKTQRSRAHLSSGRKYRRILCERQSEEPHPEDDHVTENSTTHSNSNGVFHLRRSQRQHRRPTHLHSEVDSREEEDERHVVLRNTRGRHLNENGRTNSRSAQRRGRRVVLINGEDVDDKKDGQIASSSKDNVGNRLIVAENGDEGSELGITTRLRRRNGPCNNQPREITQRHSTRDHVEEDEDEDSEEDQMEGRRYPMRERRQRMPFGIQNNSPRRRQRTRWSLSSPVKEEGASRRERKHHLQRSGSTTSSSSGNSGSDERRSNDSDERRFQRRKSKSMLRIRNELLPMNFSNDDVMTSFRRDRLRAGASLADVAPMAIDRSITFESIGGNEQQIQALKESVVLPLLYSDLFQKLGIQPPRGLLFYGPPGTGKTLLARALANECSLGNRKVAFFMRKGADCLSKWVGESERQLRLLFDQAYRVRPSIIFFDEFDGLAPVRSSRQDQIHASIVSTLLALIDGLDDRGEVIVIGATNRVDAIDPALRRPGRFDREFTFFPPDEVTRRKILKIHCSKGDMLRSQMEKNDDFLDQIASKTAGYTGADLRAVVTEASLCALRRNYPQVYTSKTKLIIDPTNIKVEMVDFLQALNIVQPSSQRIIAPHARPLSHSLEPLINPAVLFVCRHINRVFPYVPKTLLQESTSSDENDFSGLVQRHPSLLALNHRNLSVVTTQALESMLNNLMVDSKSDSLNQDASIQELWSACSTRNPRLLLPGPLSRHLVPAVLYAFEKISVFCISVTTIHAGLCSPEENISHIFREAFRSVPSILYLPSIDLLWESISPMARSCLLEMLEQTPNSMHNGTLLLLATTSKSLVSNTSANSNSTSDSVSDQEVPDWQKDLVDVIFAEDILPRFHHTSEQRSTFLRPIFLIWPFIPPRTISKQAFEAWIAKAMEPLPEVPSEPINEVSNGALNAVEQQKLWDEEEEILRKLRMCMRHIVAELGKDRRFGIFSRPVDPEDVPDYYEVITNPMDFSRLLDHIDQHLYDTPETFEKDLEQIYLNALEYNPESVPKSRDIRHRAHDLRDCYGSLCRLFTAEIREECAQIKESRKLRAASDNNPSKSEQSASEDSKNMNSISTTGANNSRHGNTSCHSNKQPHTSQSSSVAHNETSRRSRISFKRLEESSQTPSKPSTTCPTPPADTCTVSPVKPPPANPNNAPQTSSPSPSRSPKKSSDGHESALQAQSTSGSCRKTITGITMSRMKHLHKRCIECTETWSYPLLEQLHSKLTLIVNQHRGSWDRHNMLQEIESLLIQFKITL